MKLGKDSDVPEFTNIEWFAMIFCCGVATGLFFFSCGEPINHYEPCGNGAWAGPDFSGNKHTKCLGDSWWANRYSHMSDNERAQHAMTLTFYHWGLHGWVCYAVVGALLGVLHWRKGLPMTMKTCFYPLIGKRVYSAWGDVIDAVSIACTTFGVCTSLAMGVSQMNAGIRMVNMGKNWLSSTPYFGTANKADWYDDWKDRTKDVWEMQSEQWKQGNPWDDNGAMAGRIASFIAETDEKMFLIWIITFISTISITTGLNVGVKWLSLIALIAGFFLLWVIVVMDDTFFLMNLFVQTIGHYFQYVTEIGFYTGAFDQPEHAAPDGRQEYRGWMNDWTIFYWGWWISWAPFVGVFLARISKGRTLREFLVTALFITVAYNFFWMNVWGGATLKMEMSAEKAGVQCDDPAAPKYFRTNYCREDPSAIAQGFGRYDGASTYFCSTVTRIGCHGFNYPPMIYDLVLQYGSLGPFLSMIIIICLFLYFITSSDSGSLVDSIVASNGLEEPCVLQRVYWSLTEGAAASSLLYTSNFMIDDSNASMKALQALSIAGGLPYTVLVCFMCVALWKALRFETGEEKFFHGFRSSALDIGITLYAGNELGGACSCSFFPSFDSSKFVKWAYTCVCPFKLFAEIQPKLEDLKYELEQKKSERAIDKRSPIKRMAILGFTALLFYAGWILIFIDGAVTIEDPYVARGEKNGSYNLMTKEYSSRYGHFYETTNDYKNGERITHPDELTKKEIARGMEMATGDRRGASHMHLAVFGWFFYMFFACIITELRTSTREALKISGNIFEDFLASVFFYPSVLIQILEVLERGKRIPDSGELAKDQQYQEPKTGEQLPGAQSGDQGAQATDNSNPTQVKQEIQSV
jgi:choline-glycine betaine transporter